MAKEKYLECGKAVSTHGVRGTLRLENYCDTPEKLAKMRRMYIRNNDGTMKLMKVRAASVQKSMVLVTFEEIDDLNKAILYKGTVFYADRGDMKLEKNQVFIADILDLPVIDADSGEKYGTLAEVITPGGREVYVIDDVRGGQFMVPAVPEFIIEIKDEGEGAGIFVRLIEGMRE